MNTRDIDQKLADISQFRGAYACDLLPAKPNGDFSVVINTDDSSASGDHWLVLARKNEKLFFIDSYGRDYRDPTFDPNFKKLIMNYIGEEKVVCNRKWLQRMTSNVCGEYCVYFIRELSEKSFRSCFSVFGVNLAANDLLVLTYVKSLKI